MATELRSKVQVGMAEALRDAGVSPADVLAHAGLPPDLLDVPGSRVSLRDYFALWQSIATVSGDPAIGIILVTLIRPEITEPLFLAVLSASNVADAIDIVARYKAIFEPQGLLIERDDAAGCVELTLPDPESDLRQPSVLVDTQFAFIVEMCRRGTGRADLNPRELRLRKSSVDSPTYAGFFRCPITTGSKTNTLVFAAGDTALPFATHNPQMLHALVPFLRAALPEPATSVVARVRVAMRERIRGQRATIKVIARDLAMSPRALQRALRDNGTSFRQLLDDVRSEHAETYLASTSFSNSEVAFLLGFEDESSFSRAFRAWNGVTPAMFRRRAAAAG